MPRPRSVPKSDPLVDLDPLRVYPKADPARPSPPPPYQAPTDTLKAKHAMLANTYGIAMPAKMDIECQILSKCVPHPSRSLAQISPAPARQRPKSLRGFSTRALPASSHPSL